MKGDKHKLKGDNNLVIGHKHRIEGDFNKIYDGMINKVKGDWN